MFDKTEKLVLSITGMHCDHCRMNTENAIRSVKGVKKASVDLQSGTAEVVYVPAKVSPEEIAAAVDAIGFKAGIV